MRVHLVQLGGLAQRFEEQGDAVSHGEPVPLDADLYLFGGGHQAMKRLYRGLVILDLRADADLAWAAWSAYADLCLVADTTARTTLVEVAGCEPGRVFVAAEDAAVLDLAGRAFRDELPPVAVERPDDPVPDETLLSALSELPALAIRLDALERQADVMQRGYSVHSRVPIFGPLIAWVRRNLTSHLREPYLDPTLERQVRLNRDLIAVLRELLRRQAELEARLEEKERTSDG